MLSSIVIFLIIGIAAAEDCKGCVSLDSYSFDKVFYEYIKNDKKKIILILELIGLKSNYLKINKNQLFF